MHRNVLIDWFLSAKGRILQRQEAGFLAHEITVSCKQIVLQIGALGWEKDFIDCSLYESFIVLDDEEISGYKAKIIKADSHFLPLQTAIVDMVIVPHLLEFNSHKHQVLREVERVLKPEGKLIIMGFNPWNMYINLQYLRYRVAGAPWVPSLVTRTRLKDWLRLLNFEVEVVAGFNFDDSQRKVFDLERRKKDFLVTAYAIKAIKRSYHLIPIESEKAYQSRFAMAKVIDLPVTQKKYNEKN